MDAVWNEIVSALTNGNPAQLPLALVGMAATGGADLVSQGARLGVSSMSR